MSVNVGLKNKFVHLLIKYYIYLKINHEITKLSD